VKQKKSFEPINLKQWAKDNPATEFEYKGIQHSIAEDNYTIAEDTTLNKYQRMHLNAEINIYEPIEAYSQDYKHISHTSKDKYGLFRSAVPVGEKKRNDLPPLYLQWKEDYRRRYANKH